MNGALAAGTMDSGGTELPQSGPSLAASGPQTLLLSIVDRGDQIRSGPTFPPLRREQTWGRGTGAHGVNPSGTQSDPVQRDWRVRDHAVDLEIPAIGAPFSLGAQLHLGGRSRGTSRPLTGAGFGAVAGAAFGVP
jgi:hypothetical protein